MFQKKFLIFTRRKISFFVIPSLIISAIFIIYQITIFVQISNESKPKPKLKPNLIRGTHEKQAKFYLPNAENKFKCISSFEEIDYKRVNDDYCDCLDGSDEPGTNACPNGMFYCATQGFTKRFKKFIVSDKVNDGICDCCDGSDEWNDNRLLSYDYESQKKADRYHVPCPNMC
ncbi:hypothetical protein NQ317_008373 [Molorchus minor]|uniref:Glucosidase II beta subunit N-terminal domain-containing protein n=1 Tax=Molorchus minor TaxID=1323400 RepID=A0ABQ9K743_9CUCU|nr:hypothetical protein NQ317_008373 [Molorchus minor]